MLEKFDQHPSAIKIFFFFAIVAAAQNQQLFEQYLQGDRFDKLL